MNTRTQRGFTVVELMVAMTLSLILMAGVLSLFFSSKVTYVSSEKNSRLQENGRVALDLIVHDIRSAGYLGCAKGMPLAETFTSALNSPTSSLWNYELPLQGYEADGTGTFSPALDIALDPTPVADSDVIVVHALARGGRALTAQTDLGNSTEDPQVTNTASAPVSVGQVMMITDCNASSVFQVSGWVSGALNGRILHAAGGANPGNATDDLGYAHQRGARILPLETVIYWVGDTGTGPALWRQIGAAAPEVLADGVQALQAAYGEDTNGDRLADGYFAADSVTNWDNVISVTLSLLVRSEETGTDVDRATYSLLDPALGGSTLGPYNDRRQRMLFNITVTLRNRAV